MSRWSSNRFTDTVIGRSGNARRHSPARRAASITTDQPMRTSSVLVVLVDEELAGREQPAAGVVPAQERLDLDRAPVRRSKTGW